MDQLASSEKLAHVSPRVSIVAVTWNRCDCIETLLLSLAGLDYPNFEIVVVDNASTDGTVEMIRREHPAVVLIANDQNLGGSGGFNSGMRHVIMDGKSSYIWLLDNDAEVFPDTLTELIRVLVTDPGIGLAGSAIVNPDKPEAFVELGVNINWRGGYVEPFQENRLRADVPEGVFEVDFVPACSVAVRCALLNPTQLMDERYFLWWDDADFCCSLRARGSRTVCVSRSVVRHPTEKSRAIINYFNLRNGLLFFAKHAPALRLPGIYAALAVSAAKVIAYNRLSGRQELGHYLQLAIRDFLNGRWGKFNHALPIVNESGDSVTLQVERILITPSSNLENITLCLAHLRERFPAARIELLIQSYRATLFQGVGFDGIVTYNDRRRFSLARQGWLFMKVLCSCYDLAANADRDFTSPFSFAAKHHVGFDASSGEVVLSSGRSKSWCLIATLLAGWLAGPLLFLAIFIRGIRYRHER